jgi:hypothetical protein
MTFATSEASYDKLSHMLCKILERNIGEDMLMWFISRIPWVALAFLKGCCFCLVTCMGAFQFYLLVICIDSTFLNGKYKGKILTRTTINGYHHITFSVHILIKHMLLLCNM